MAEPQPIETAPKDGTRFWGIVDDDAIAMFWHPGFGEFISSFRRMTMAPGYLIDDKPYKDHYAEKCGHLWGITPAGRAALGEKE